MIVFAPATAEAFKVVDPLVDPEKPAPPLDINGVVKAGEVPNEVNDDPTTVDFKKAPLKVVASAVTVISVLPSKATPFMFFVVVNFVAVAALPVNVPVNDVELTELNPVRFVEVPPKEIIVEPMVMSLFARLKLLIPAEPLRLAFVKFVIRLLPTSMVLLVKVSVPASVDKVPELGNVKVVGAVEFKVVGKAPEVTKLPPRLMVFPELSIPVPPFAPNTMPVRALPAAGTVIFELPSKKTPLILLAVCNFVAVAALPPIFKLLTGVVEVTKKGAIPVAWLETSCPESIKLVPVATPIVGLINSGLVSITNLLPNPVCEATVVVLPMEVIGPFKFALVVTVDAFPFKFPLKLFAVMVPLVLTSVTLEFPN